MVPKDQEFSFHLNGRNTFYIKGLKESRNYKQAPTNCAQDLKKEIGKAIEASSLSAAAQSRRAVTFTVTGDDTTWGDEGGAHCTASQGLHCGNKARRLMMSIKRRPEKTVPDARGGRGRPSTMEYTDDIFASVGALPREAKTPSLLQRQARGPSHTHSPLLNTSTARRTRDRKSVV